MCLLLLLGSVVSDMTRYSATLGVHCWSGLCRVARNASRGPDHRATLSQSKGSHKLVGYPWSWMDSMVFNVKHGGVWILTVKQILFYLSRDKAFGGG